MLVFLVLFLVLVLVGTRQQLMELMELLGCSRSSNKVHSHLRVLKVRKRIITMVQVCWMLQVGRMRSALVIGSAWNAQTWTSHSAWRATGASEIVMQVPAYSKRRKNWGISRMLVAPLNIYVSRMVNRTMLLVYHSINLDRLVLADYPPV